MSRYQHNSYTFVLLGGELRTYYGDDHNLEPAGPTRRDHVIRHHGQLVAMIDADTVTRMEVLRHNEPDHEPQDNDRYAPALIDILRDAGNEWGPLGVALAAASLTDPATVISRLATGADATPPPDQATIDGYVTDAGGGHIDIIVHRDTPDYPLHGTHATISFDRTMYADKPRDALPEPEPAHGAPTGQADTEWLAGLADPFLAAEIADRYHHWEAARSRATAEAWHRALDEQTARHLATPKTPAP